MGTLIAVVIIIALIFYALRDLLIDRDFSAWTNIALTSLILFTVILSIFMILHKQPAPDTARAQTEQEEQTPAEQEPVTEEQRSAYIQEMAAEYAAIENDCIKNNGSADCAGFTNDYIKKSYEISDEEFDGWLEYVETSGILQEARDAYGGGK